MIRQAVAALAMVLALSASSVAEVTIASPLHEGRIAPLMEFVRLAVPGSNPVHRTIRGPVVASEWRGQRGTGPSIAILPNPEIAVALTNDGLVARLNRLPADLEGAGNWRHELVVLAYDPAVMVYRRDAFAEREVPRSRLGLTQLLEQDRSLFRRAGIVNVGISNRAYTLATQDSLRSPLFWRLAQAFGATQARIYDSEADLLDAMAQGAIDIGYNIPLSELTARDGQLAHAFPEDYVLSMPWSLLLRRGGADGRAGDIASALVSPKARRVIERDVLLLSDDTHFANDQPIIPGPELLVFLDQIKRSRFLDDWFQFVAGN